MTVVVTIFRVVASCTSVTMILSPIPMIYKIHKTKTTGHASILPLVGMFNNCHVVMMFGYLTKQYFPVFSTFIIGDVFSFIYVATFYRYSHEKPRAHRIIAAIGIPLLFASIYALLGGLGYTNQRRRVVGNFLGYYSIPAALLLYAAPMEKVRQVFRHRSAVFLPIHMICAGTTNNLMWIIYSSLVGEWLIFAPNMLAFTFGVFQILLYLAFHPRTHPLQLPTPQSLEIELELGVSPSNHAAINEKSLSSPSFVPLASPLEPIHPQKIPV